MAQAALVEPTDISVDYAHLVSRLIGLMRTSDEPLTLDDLAETAGLSPFHFARIFRAVSGVPPVEFQTSLRFARAKEMLLTTPASVTEVCFEVGYGSLGTFSRRFKQMVGVTPNVFRDLPEVVADMDLEEPITRGVARARGPKAQISGTVDPHDGGSRVFIGIFEGHLPASQPVVGQMLPEPGPFLLPDVPPGRYHLMAAALPRAGDPIDQLLPGAGVLVGGAGMVEVRTGVERLHRVVHLREFQPTDPPLLTALPALLL
jgi:AraC family transcriptional regulator